MILSYISGIAIEAVACPINNADHRMARLLREQPIHALNAQNLTLVSAAAATAENTDAEEEMAQSNRQSSPMLILVWTVPSAAAMRIAKIGSRIGTAS
jgi:hypothetical protein